MNRQGVREHFVYWMFDASGNCLYVGMTRLPKQRWQQHKRLKPQMAAEVKYCRMAGPFHQDTARRLERERQDDLQPKHDEVQRMMRTRALALPHAPTKWAGATS